ncbi:MAG: AAA family ATPase [Desulfobacterales bacterium]
MYEKFFGFKERPFQLVPNPAYLFLSRSHEEALAHLSYAVSQGDGFVEITGEVGTGKTTLCRVFLGNLGETVEAAYIFNPMLDAVQLLRAVNDEFGIPSDAGTVKELIDRLNIFLMERKRAGKKVILLIDEAQNLRADVLEQLRLLSNLETETSKLIQIILVGQPELREKLDSPELRQLSQRITLSCHLTPLNYKETRAYILHRIHIAAQKTGVRFARSAFKTIQRYSGGIPRLINIACDRAMLTAFSLNSLRITGRIARNAVQELASRGEMRKMAASGSKRTLTALTALSLMLIPVVLFLPDYLDRNFGRDWPSFRGVLPFHLMQKEPVQSDNGLGGAQTPPSPVSAESLPEKGENLNSASGNAREITKDAASSANIPAGNAPAENFLSDPVQSPPADPEKTGSPEAQPVSPDETLSEKPADAVEPAEIPSEDAQRQTSGEPEKSSPNIPAEDLESVLKAQNTAIPSRQEALRALIRLWQPYAVIRDAKTGEEDLTYFTYWARQNSFSLLPVENDPQLIQKLNLPALLEFRLPRTTESCYLTLTRISKDRIILLSGDRQIVSGPDVFSQYWTGRAFILWKNFFGLAGTIPREASRESLLTLKTILQDIGFVGLENTAVFDDLTRDAVKMIQGKHGLHKDGVVGFHTKIVLYNEIPGLNIPHITEGISQPGSQTREIRD